MGGLAMNSGSGNLQIRQFALGGLPVRRDAAGWFASEIFLQPFSSHRPDPRQRQPRELGGVGTRISRTRSRSMCVFVGLTSF